MCGSLEHCELTKPFSGCPAVKILRSIYTGVEHVLGLNRGTSVNTLCSMFVFTLPVSKHGRRACCWRVCHGAQGSEDGHAHQTVENPWVGCQLSTLNCHEPVVCQSHIWTVPGPLAPFITVVVRGFRESCRYFLSDALWNWFAGFVFHKRWYAKQIRLYPHRGEMDYHPTETKQRCEHAGEIMKWVILVCFLSWVFGDFFFSPGAECKLEWNGLLTTD